MLQNWWNYHLSSQLEQALRLTEDDEEVPLEVSFTRRRWHGECRRGQEQASTYWWRWSR